MMRGMTNAEASVEAAAGGLPKRSRGGFFSLPDRRGMALTVYRTLLFAGLGLFFEVLAINAAPLDVSGVAGLLAPPYRYDLDMEHGFMFMGTIATLGCFLFCLPSPSLRRHHRWLCRLLYLLFLVALCRPRF